MHQNSTVSVFFLTYKVIYLSHRIPTRSEVNEQGKLKDADLLFL